jgi:uracil-DNA glycosylase family 4
LTLFDCAITATCHCAPPDNKPTLEEIGNCRPWLDSTLNLLPTRVYVALGKIGWDSIARELRRRGALAGKLPAFGHGAEAELSDGRRLLGSYHPSQQNTFTGKLTEAMLDNVFARAKELLRDA